MGDLDLGLMWGYWGQLPPPNLVELTQEAERLGFASVWTSESWGSDAFSPLAYLAAVTEKIQLGTAVAQLAARTPTATAMHALTIDHLSNGRFNLGLGVSGPQVVEGWYGQPSNKPLARTREYVEIIRRVIAREEKVDFQGEHYQHPYTGPGSVGLGKALKPITHPLRRRIPIFIGAEGPKNVTQTAEIADGWFPLYYSPWRQDVYADQLAGAAVDFQVSVICPFVVTGPSEAEIADGLAGIQMMLAFYIGGMGAEGQNYHTKLAARMGLGDAAMEIQRLFLAGDQAGGQQEQQHRLAEDLPRLGEDRARSSRGQLVRPVGRHRRPHRRRGGRDRRGPPRARARDPRHDGAHGDPARIDRAGLLLGLHLSGGRGRAGGARGHLTGLGRRHPHQPSPRMLTVSPAVRIYLAAGATDLRRSVDGLSMLVRERFGLDPLSGHLFVFRNRRGDRLKILVWDRSGFWVLYKRLEQGTFAWPTEASPTPVTITSRDLLVLLSGVDLTHARRRRWYDRESIA